MDRKKIIEENLLEKYLLGSLTTDEIFGVEGVLEKDDELQKMFSELEADFELIGRENAVEPPESVKEKLKQRLDTIGELKASQIPALNDRAETTWSTRLLVAASLAALFALGSFWLYIQWQNSLEDLNMLKGQTAVLQDRISDLERQYSATQERYVNISNPEAIPLYLVGNQVSPESRVTAYVNHKDKTVIVNGSGLVPLNRDQAYQMWADVEGEMINMGLVSPEQDYIPLRYIDKAESFNITIEPAGGSDHPTVENLISNIYL